MKSFASNARRMPLRMRMGKLCFNPNHFLLVLAFAGITMLFPQVLHAQSGSIQWTVKDGFQIGYQLSTASDTIPALTQFDVDLHLETFEETEAIGAYFELQLPDQVTPPATGTYSLPAANPLGIPQDLKVSYTWNAQTRESNAAVWRSDSVSQSVSGNVLRLHFSTGTVPVPTASLVQAFDGGLVIEDNLDMKMAEEEGLVSPSAAMTYPNPCREWLTIDLPEDRADSYILRDLTGREWQSGAAVPGARIDLSGVPPGVLIVDIRDAQGKSILVNKIVKL